MKRLSISLLALSFLLVLLTMGFTKKPTHAARPSQKIRDVGYYFYNNSDNFVDWATADDEAYELEEVYNVLVDQNSIGGTLLEEGYVNPGKPHMGFPDVFLYGHF